MKTLETFSDVMDTLPMEELRDILLRPRPVTTDMFICMVAWLGKTEAPTRCAIERVMVICGAFPTISEARRKIKQGGVKWNGKSVRDSKMIPDWIWPGWGILALGKKQNWLVIGRQHNNEQTTQTTTAEATSLGIPTNEAGGALEESS